VTDGETGAIVDAPKPIECRKYGLKNCFERARTAHDERVREQYANLGQIWLECAVRAELRSAVITPPEPTTAQKVALTASGGKRRAVMRCCPGNPEPRSALKL
jgi:hypothetical protein